MRGARIFAAALGVVSALAGAGLAGPAAAAPGGKPRLVVRNAAMSLVVQPEDRSDIAVQVWRPNAHLPLQVTHDGANVVIDGHLLSFLTSCHGSGEGLRVLAIGHGDFGVAQMPQVLVHVPMDAVVEAGGIVHGAVARSRNLTLGASGCGDLTVGNVAGHLDASASGVGSLRTGSARSAEVSLSGTGHVALGQVQTQLVARLSGAGLLAVRTAGAADVSISGSGDVTTGPIAGPLRVQLSGAGNLKAESVEGPVTAEVSGIGNVTIAGGHAPSLSARVSGTGSVRFDGVADALDAEVSGVGSVNVARVTGSINQHVSGVGSVHVGGR